MKLSTRLSPRNRVTYYKNIVFFIAVFSLSSCANMSEQQRMYAEATGIGTGLGAGIGAVACSDNRAACAAGGGVIGGALGYGIGIWQANDIGQRDQKNVHTEKVTNNLQQQNARISDYNYQLGRQISQYEQGIRRGRHDRKGVKMNLITAQNERNKLQSVVAGERRKMARMSNSDQRRSCQNQLRKLEREMQQLNRSISKLQSLNGYGRAG